MSVIAKRTFVAIREVADFVCRMAQQMTAGTAGAHAFGNGYQLGGARTAGVAISIGGGGGGVARGVNINLNNNLNGAGVAGVGYGNAVRIDIPSDDDEEWEY